MRQVLKQFSGWVEMEVSKAGLSAGVGFSAIAATPHDPCGRGLAPDSGGSGNTWLTDLRLSGASRIVAPPLPHLDRRRLQDRCAACHSGGAWVSKAGFSVRVGFSTIATTPHDPYGRGLAPDSGGSGNTWLTDLPRSGASPLPHLDQRRLQDCCATGLLTAQSPKWLCWKISAPFAPPPDAPDFHCLGYNN